MSSGSLAELETHFTVTEVVGHLEARQLLKVRGYAEEVSRMIWAVERGLAR